MKRMSFDDLWEYLPEKWQWVGQLYRNRLWCACEVKPSKGDDYYYAASGEFAEIPFSLDYDGPWEESLHERPRPKVWYHISAAGFLVVHSEENDYSFDARADEVHEAPPEVAEWYREVMRRNQ